MSTALKLLAGIVLASIFMGIFVALQTNFDRSNEISAFKEDSQKLAETINGLKSLGPSDTEIPFEITVPENCELKFENNDVFALVSNDTYSYSTELFIKGGALSPGAYNLRLVRTEEGIRINAR